MGPQATGVYPARRRKVVKSTPGAARESRTGAGRAGFTASWETAMSLSGEISDGWHSLGQPGEVDVELKPVVAALEVAFRSVQLPWAEGPGHESTIGVGSTGGVLESRPRESHHR